MKFIDSAVFRDHESRFLEGAPGPAAECGLVAHAGRLLAIRLASLLREMGLPPSAGVEFFAGKGNNGADALAAACLLHDAGYRTAVHSTVPFPPPAPGGEPASEPPRDALFRAVREKGIPCSVRETPEAWASFRPSDGALGAVWVDALLGTGAAGAPRGAVAAAIRVLNDRPAAIPVLAVDIPSGLDPATGAPSPDATVRADLTLCMACPKSCLAAPASRDFAGTVEVAPMPELADPGLPASPAGLDLVGPSDLLPLFPPLPRDSHKGTRGRVLLVGGCPLYPGALVLAADAATRSGAGLVRACTSPAAVAAILARCPEAIARDDLYGDLPLSERPSAILCGPGLGRDAEARRIVATLLHETPAPLVLDADALSMLGSKTDALGACTRPLLLTPHAAEAASLLGCTPAGIQRDRPAAAAELARRANATVILKGDGTLIATPGGATLWINLCGNPGMATAGSGDILAGLLAGLLAQGLPAHGAARAAVWLHGTAGDIAARRLGERPIRASDIADALPAAFRSLHRPTA